MALRRLQILAIALIGLGFLSGTAELRQGPQPSDAALRGTRIAPPVPSVEEDPAQMVYEELAWRHTGLADRDLRAVSATIVSEAVRHDMDWRLVMAVIQVESGGYNFATSHVGALGLMQIMPQTGRQLAGELGLTWRGPDMLLDPIVNVQMGVSYLRQLADRYDGSWRAALAAYNWGPARIDSRIRRGAGLPRLYAEQVLKLHDEAAQLAQVAARS
jgi:soluble lytic murein transglycosylase-like protein